jgi:hypothetical protein
MQRFPVVPSGKLPVSKVAFLLHLLITGLTALRICRNYLDFAVLPD